MAGTPHHPRTPHHPCARWRRTPAAVVLALVAATVAGCGAASGSDGAATPSPAVTGSTTLAPTTAGSPTAGPSTATTAGTTPARTPIAKSVGPSSSADPFANLPGPQPLPSTAAVRATRVSVPAMGVDSALELLTVDSAKVLQAPVDPQLAGWYAGGTVPGDPGPAVIAGHVDSQSGPAVFYQLKQLKVGSVVSVTRSDGRVVRFRVDGVDQYPKDDFPTEAVYGPTPDPSLRLITCGGTFDYASHHYRDNVVAYASLIS